VVVVGVAGLFEEVVDDLPQLRGRSSSVASSRGEILLDLVDNRIAVGAD